MEAACSTWRTSLPVRVIREALLKRSTSALEKLMTF